MALKKVGITVGTLIVSNMIFICSSCEHFDVIDGDNYDPHAERKCPKCQNAMILNSTNSSPIDENKCNKGGDWFEKPSQ